MAAKTNYLLNKEIDAYFRGVTYTPPATLYIGLFTATPTAAGGGTEVSGGSYARAALAPSTTNWAATNAAGSTTNPSSGTSGQTSNNVAITFPTPTGSWGTVGYFAIFDALAGNMLYFGPLTTGVAITTGIAPVTFAIGSIVITEN